MPRRATKTVTMLLFLSRVLSFATTQPSRHESVSTNTDSRIKNTTQPISAGSEKGTVVR